MKIIIDSGHGGSDTGAIAFGTFEKDINLVFSTKLASSLEKSGYDVDTSIIDDINYDSNALTSKIKSSGAQICISCHNNAFDGKARGMEVIHSIHSDGELAKLILNEISKTGYITRRVFSRESTVNPNTDYYFIIRQTYPQVETIIVEFGFLDNLEDYKLITAPEWQDILVSAVTEGIKKYAPPKSLQKTPIMGQAELTPEQLAKALSANNPSASSSTVALYYQISEIYGIKADLAFLQSMLETNWLKFTGIVKPEQNNFAGLGATGGTNSGEVFSTPEIGIEAHIQHLYAYATTAQLPAGRPLYDTRFKYVQRGSAPNWEDLNGRWAVPGTTYGQTILAMQKKVSENYPSGNSGEDPENPKPHWAKQCNDELLEAGLLYNDHSSLLDQPASEGMVICLINRLRKLAASGLPPEQPQNPAEPGVHWAKQCNDELLEAGLLYNDHAETLDSPASEAMVLCLANRLRKELIKNE